MGEERDIELLLLACETALAQGLAPQAAVRTHAAADDALAAMRGGPPALAVLDFGRADAEARRLLERLRSPADSPAPGLPVIGLVGRASPETIRGLVKSGVDQVMVKPVSAQAVLELARHLLEAPTAQARSDSYHGPDRRRVAPPHYDGPNRRED